MAAASAFLACSAAPTPAGAAQAAKADAPTAYLRPGSLPDPRGYLPPPPQPGSPAAAADRAAYESALAGRDGPAWRQAVAQADIRSPGVRRQIMCALGARLDLTPASAVGRLMSRSGLALAQASEQAKAVWPRDRPYVGEKDAVTCDPNANFGTQSPSYPSGHAAIGWMWALMLAELAPDRSGGLLGWGAGVGDNRIACRVHYPSDVAAGRMLGAAVLARLRAEPAFRADLEAARAEIGAARAAGAKPDCAAD